MKVKVENMKSGNGKSVANQFILHDVLVNGLLGIAFQSYKTIIAFKPYIRQPWQLGETQLIKKEQARTQICKGGWAFSVTTGKYRNIFLGETKKETQAKIDSGEYILTDLN